MILKCMILKSSLLNDIFYNFICFFKEYRIVHTCGMCEEICKIENLKSHSWKITTILLMKILYIFIEY